MKLIDIVYALLAAFFLLIELPASAAYPDRPPRVIIGFAPGGGTDIIGRVIAERLGDAFKIGFVPENRPGANAALAAELVAKAPPDGYTLLIGTSAELTLVPNMQPSTPYDPAADLWPIAFLGTTPNILIGHPAAPGNNTRELINYVKANPGKLTYGAGGMGPYLSGELFKAMAGLNIVPVLYKGGGPAQNDLIGGHIPLMVSTVPAATPLIRTGKAKAYAVTSMRRAPQLPDVPTLAEQGLEGYEAITWFGLFVPAKTPKDVVDTLRMATQRILTDKAVQLRLESLGLETGSVDEGGTVLQDRIRRELAKWGKVIKEAGIKGY